MGTRDLTHKAIAEALSNDRLLTHDQRAALLTLVADDSVWQRKHDEAAAEVTRLVDKCNSYIVDNARLAEQVESLRAEVAQARETAEYWKAEHLAGNARIGELHDELAATALRSADHLRKAVKAEAEVEWLRLKCSEHQDGRLAALERVATLERRLQEIGDLAASSATGPAQFESLKMIEEMCGLGA